MCERLLSHSSHEQAISQFVFYSYTLVRAALWIIGGFRFDLRLNRNMCLFRIVVLLRDTFPLSFNWRMDTRMLGSISDDKTKRAQVISHRGDKVLVDPITPLRTKTHEGIKHIDFSCLSLFMHSHRAEWQEYWLYNQYFDWWRTSGMVMRTWSDV